MHESGLICYPCYSKLKTWVQRFDLIKFLYFPLSTFALLRLQLSFFIFLTYKPKLLWLPISLLGIVHKPFLERSLLYLRIYIIGDILPKKFPRPHFYHVCWPLTGRMVSGPTGERGVPFCSQPRWRVAKAYRSLIHLRSKGPKLHRWWSHFKGDGGGMVTSHVFLSWSCMLCLKTDSID